MAAAGAVLGEAQADGDPVLEDVAREGVVPAGEDLVDEGQASAGAGDVLTVLDAGRDAASDVAQDAARRRDGTAAGNGWAR